MKSPATKTLEIMVSFDRHTHTHTRSQGGENETRQQQIATDYSRFNLGRMLRSRLGEIVCGEVKALSLKTAEEYV